MRGLGLNATNGSGNDLELSAGPTLFSCHIIADTAQLRPARHAIAYWATEIGLRTERVEDVAMAVGEALSNSIEHAYPTESGQIDIVGEVTGGELRVAVSDYGRWRTPQTHPGWRGRGISMIDALADHAQVERRESGTTVTMVWNLLS